MTVKYVAYTWQGQRVEGVLETDSEDAAYEMLRRQSLIPYKARIVVRRRSLVEIAPWLFQPKPKDVTDFSRQLASLLDSGIPLRQALRVLRDQSRNTGLRHALRLILQDIEAGGRFSDACGRHPTVFPAAYVQLLRIGEALGSITTTLRQLAQDMQRRADVASRVRGAMVYPAISLVVAIMATFVLMKFSLPALISLISEFGGELPLPTRILIASSNFTQQNGTYVMLGLLVIGVAMYLYIRTRSGARLRDRLLLRAPVIGGIILQGNMFALTSTLAALLRSGVATLEALRLSGEAATNAVIREQLTQVSGELAQGERLGESFQRQPVFPPLLSQGVITAEVSGSLANTLDGLAEYYEAQTQRLVGAATELIQPAITILVAGVVAFIAVAVVGGIYSTLGSVAQPQQ